MMVSVAPARAVSLIGPGAAPAAKQVGDALTTQVQHQRQRLFVAVAAALRMEAVAVGGGGGGFRGGGAPAFHAAVAAVSEAVARPFMVVAAADSELQPRRSMAAASAQGGRPLSAAVSATAPPSWRRLPPWRADNRTASLHRTGVSTTAIAGIISRPHYYGYSYGPSYYYPRYYYPRRFCRS